MDFDFELDLDTDLQLQENGETIVPKDPTKRATLIMVDVNSSMFERPAKPENSEETLSSFALSLTAIRQMIRTSVFESETDEFAIVLFGTSATMNEWQVPNMTVLQPFTQPNADLIRQVETLRSKVQHPQFSTDDLTVLAPVSSFDFVHVFSLGLQLLGTKPSASFNRYLYILTNQNPSLSDDVNNQMAQYSKQRLKDLNSSDISVFFFPCPPLAQDSFITSHFWRTVADLSPEELEELTVELMQVTQQDVVKRKGIKRRSTTKLPLTVIRLPLVSIKLDKETNQLLTTRSSFIDDETGEELTKDDLQKYFGFADVAVPFTDIDIATIKGISEPGIRLLGFKPLASLTLEANIRPAILIRPGAGSEQIFYSFYRGLKARGVYAIARYCPSARTVPYLVAMLPSPPKREGVSELGSTECLWLVKLPYKEDFRDVFDFLRRKGEDCFSDETVSERKTEAAMNIIDKLTIDYDPVRFDNPFLQNWYSYIEAMALKTAPEEPNDLTWVSNDVFDEVAGDVAVLLEGTKVKKASGRAKKADVDVSSITDDEMKSKIDDGSVKKLTKAVLTEFLRGKGVRGISSLKKEI
ncbi:hypothetical protein GEMRC1_014194 [Eukaryota sp. GEM-RC1]